MNVSMNEPRQPADKVTPPRPQKVLVEFIEALHRIIKIGTYYPQGHAALDRAAHLFQHSLQKLTEETTSAGIELKGATLVVENQEITTNHPALTEIMTIFRDLGIGRVEIDRAVTLKDLLQMIKTLLQHRSQLQGIKQFTKARLVDLPATVRVFQQEFLVEETAYQVASNDSEADLDAVFLALEETGAGPETDFTMPSLSQFHGPKVCCAAHQTKGPSRHQLEGCPQALGQDRRQWLSV